MLAAMYVRVIRFIPIKLDSLAPDVEDYFGRSQQMSYILGIGVYK